MINRYFIVAVFSALLFLSSCGSSKKIAYFQPLPNDSIPSTFAIVAPQEITIVPNDLLTVVVSALDPAAAAPFAMPSLSAGSTSSNNVLGYLVDRDGNINFPVLGTIKVGGLTRAEAAALISQKLIPYLKDPIVTLRFMNFKVSILGEVGRPGSFSIENERINLLEALAMAGDLNISGKRENVLIMRENEDGVRSSARVDLTSTEVFRSPFFYLQQNDIIYVEPNKTRVMAASYTRQNLPFFISTVSGLASVTALIIALTNK